ncbi:MAG TPA: MFS transporter [Phycisphaerales bacterium]|nr:MFS transporter [Phycisphaerales bacterium]
MDDLRPGANSTARATPGARRIRVSLALLLLINLFNYIDRYILAAVEPLISKDLLRPDDPNSQGKMGLLATAFMVSYMVTAPLFGWLGDRMRRWWLIGIGVLLWTFASGASGASHEAGKHLVAAGVGWLSGYTVLFFTRCFVGVGEGAYGPIAPSLISDMFPISRRGTALAWFYAAIPVGSALGFYLGGKIGAAHGFGWPWAFYAVVPPGIVLGLWCFFRPEPVRGGMEPAGPTTSSPNKRAVYGALLRNPSYVLDVLGMTAMTFAIGGVSFWMPHYVAERLMNEKIITGATPDESLRLALEAANSTFGPIVVVAGFLATLSGGWLGDRLRKRMPGSYFIVSGAAMIIGFPLFLGVLFVPFPACWWLIGVAVFTLFFNTGPSNTIIANVTPPAMRATAYAVCIFMIHALGDAISPAIIGFVSDKAHSMNAGFMLVSVMILISGVLWIWGATHLAIDTARASGGT